MEVIKKKICLDNFISRIPGMVATVDDVDIDKCINGSWGKIPKIIDLWGTKINYKTLMDLYYSVLDIIVNSIYYEYDASGKKWLQPDFDWRDTFNHKPTIGYYTTLPEESLKDKLIVGLTNADNVAIFYDKVYELTNSSHNGFDLITSVNEIIGRIIVPYAYICDECGTIKIGSDIRKCSHCDSTQLSTHQDVFVPYFLYWKEIPAWIEFLNNIKSDNCCEKKRYSDYGGDAFLEYLQELQDKGWLVHDSGDIPTIDIPLLLTSKIIDIGQYRSYNVDVVTEDGKVITNNTTPPETTVVTTQSESKLKSLRKNKRSVADDGTELPFILTKDDEGNYITTSPYQINYIKNLQLVNNIYFGDTIVSMKEICTPKEINENLYLTLTEKMSEDLYVEGSLREPISGISTSEINPSLIRYGSKDKNNITDVETFFKTDSNGRITALVNKLSLLLKNSYPNKLCYKQEYNFKYELIYGIEDYENTHPDSDGNIITPIKEVKIQKEYAGTLFMSFDKPQIEIVYVLGARFKESGQKLILNETNAFNISEVLFSSWDGDGIWYRETFPMKKHCVDTFIIDDVTKEFTYDIIDFESKATTYKFEGIDFPRKNYILCEEVRYKSDSYYQNSTHDVIFRDEKMLGLNYPLKESYDVSIDRGTSAAFEKHAQLSELKTWQDLENYRNGMFLNK